MKDWVKELEKIMEHLRQPDGCAWDRQQDYQSLKKYLIEECGEFLDAVDDKNYNNMCEELGDIFLLICFYSQLAKEENQFDLQKVARVVSEKMIRRHPHVFGSSNATTPEEIAIQWQKIKKEEKKDSSILQEVPRNIPALMRGQKAQDKISKIVNDWQDESSYDKLKHKVEFLEKFLDSSEKNSTITNELGQILFLTIDIIRQQNLSAEDILHQTINKVLLDFREKQKIN